MKEKEVNERVRKWIEKTGYNYKGVCKRGDVTIPDGLERKLMIDHVGIKLTDEEGEVVTLLDERFYKSDKKTENLHYEQVWIEAKGSDTTLTELLEGYVKVVYSVYYSGGIGMLAVPSKEFGILKEGIKEFLEKMSLVVVGRGRVGLLNVENENELLLFV